ncbi:MAG: penicillin-binding protein [Vicinamibacterales bacterium]|nr:penicillin-binding protein [Vicinamibacterales bacterium]
MAEASNHRWRPTLKRRVLVTAVTFLLWAIGIEARLVYLQVFQHDELVLRAEQQQMRTVPAPAKRGDILDRNGRVLAASADVDSLYAVPSKVDDPSATGAALCDALGDCSKAEQQEIRTRLVRKRPFVYIRRQIAPAQAARVADLQLEGIGFMRESRRFYPKRELAAHLIGYVGQESDGLAGLESTYDKLVKGRAGTVLVQTDAHRKAFSRVERPPTAGASLELTVDEYLQYVAERELKAGVEWAGAAGGSAVVMDPATGEILALANYPTFNPNTFREFGDNHRRNRAVQDLYEPGSTFKIVTAGAALESKILTPDSTIETGPGHIRFGSRVIDEDKGHNYGRLSFTDVIVKSSNVGAIKVGLRVGAERMSEYVRLFGFGRPSSPDFKAESRGIVWAADKLTDSALASVAMGYQVGVTPLQMAAAVSVVANGGELMEPRVVRAVIRDGRRIPVPRRTLRRVINRATAADVAAMMQAVVERGTGSHSRVAGYSVAGKTGTAQKIINGRYSNTEYNVSFVGFVPVRQPAFTIVVVVDSPHGVPPYGGTVAAPIFSRIADAALRHVGVRPSVDAAPPILVTGGGRQAGPPAIPTIVSVSHPGPSGASVAPDLGGLSGREAVQMLARVGLTVRLHGTGVVVRQAPEPGEPIERGSVSTLWLDRLPSLDAVGPRP